MSSFPTCKLNPSQSRFTYRDQLALSGIKTHYPWMAGLPITWASVFHNAGNDILLYCMISAYRDIIFSYSYIHNYISQTKCMWNYAKVKCIYVSDIATLVCIGMKIVQFIPVTRSINHTENNNGPNLHNPSDTSNDLEDD